VPHRAGEGETERTPLGTMAKPRGTGHRAMATGGCGGGEGTEVDSLRG